MYKDVNIYMTYFDKEEIFQCVSSKSGNIWHRIYAHVHFDKSLHHSVFGNYIFNFNFFKDVLLVTPG